MGFVIAIIDSDLFYPKAFNIFAILPCTFTYRRRKPINHKTFLTTLWSISWDQFSNTVISEVSNLTLGHTEKSVYILSVLNTNLRTQVNKYLTHYKAFMLRIISRMILCRGSTDTLWVIFHCWEIVTWIT